MTIEAASIHDFAHRRVFVTDDHGISDYRPKPMEEVKNFRPANPRKQVFVTPGKPNHFVRKNRADDDDLIILKEPAVDVDGHVHLKQAAALVFNIPGGGNRTDVF